MQSESIGIAIALGIFVASIIGAFFLNRRHQRLRPHCRPFAWGYFLGLTGPIIGFGALRLLSDLRPSLKRAVVESFGGSLVITVAVMAIATSILTLRRNRWGFIALTALSLNPLLWIINTVYIKNRWAEFGVGLPKVTGSSPTRCEEPGCSASVTRTGTILGRATYRCAQGHQFTRAV